jgi:hypothetical protein
MAIAWRRSMCEQALNYRENSGRYADFEGEYVLLQRGEVVWHSPEGRIDASRRTLSGRRKSQSLYLKYVDLEEKEQERYAVYEQALDEIKERGI